ncbi:SusC/RagA family TonB-linked outer membrane protein [Parapedobacter koreensis]|uniref:TonB-linked outer membrane protein, SusC/RagA family n=1 Tax=Parapedobacter koreensis TaxID=332977 RepID=A0A1H7FM37_9SPHI|nr:SusC/RagA family TonB-linked outer membrane protein [Parapedobacter koreensis]SEK27041.1 TonB-linked outer membrane protein, SusC/RagA family [Parapedobacter koreensis]
MNFLLQWQWYMKITAILYFVLATTTSLLQASPSHGQVLKKRVTVSYQGTTLHDVIKDLQRQANVDFGFTKDLKLDEVTVKNVRFDDKSLREVLASLLEPNDLVFNEVAGAIVLSHKQQPGRLVGRITDERGEPLAGASIRIVELNRSFSTDGEGNFTISLQPGIYSVEVNYISYQRQTKQGVKVEESSTVTADFVLQESLDALDEVVVTALGISRQEKSLGYSVGKVAGDQLVRVPQENVLNALSGKVSGVTINQTGPTGSSVSMVIRGGTSLAGDNQPLFVIDGIPVSSTLNNVGQFGSGNPVDYGNAISDLNPEDIESMTILKGPSAAALYGSRAASGVVVVTTKSGKNAKGLRVDVSTNTVFDIPYKFYRKQNLFAPGTRPITQDDVPEGTILDLPASVTTGMGIPLDKGIFATQWRRPEYTDEPLLPTEVVGHPDNFRNFVNTGLTTTNSLSLSNGNERMNYRVGVTNMTNQGIIPGTDLNRNNFSAAGQFKGGRNFTFSTNINYTQSWADNRPAGNRGTNVLQYAMQMPNNLDIREFENYWVTGKEGQELVRLYDGWDNPYFLAYEVKNAFRRDRVYGNLIAEYQILPKLSAMARMTMDSFFERRETKIPVGYSGEPNNGAYGLGNITNYERNFDFLIKWDDRVGDFAYTLSAGGNEMYTKGTDISNSSTPGRGLISPNVFTIKNIAPENLLYSSAWSQKAIQSLYAFANLGWKDRVYLDLTARNDWSSTLPKNNRSYFYPSASLSLLVDQLIDLGPRVSLIKLRGGWAQVGNDTSPYQLLATYNALEPWGTTTRYAKSGTMLVPNLKPELATSIEFGTDLAFFQNRLRFEGTYFVVDNENQIVQNQPIPSSSGFSTTNLNMGLVQSKGWEFTLGGTPIQTAGWRWDVNVNMTRTRTVLKELAPGITRLPIWNEASAGSASWVNVGEQIGNIYSPKEVRVTDPTSEYYGYPILNSQGRWTSVSREVANYRSGNFNPDFILGANSVVSYKNFALNFTLDWRYGGEFFSDTERRIRNNGASPRAYERETIDAGGRTGKALSDWLKANDHLFTDDGLIRYVGGPTREMGGYHAVDGIAWDGTFAPGVLEQRDADGNLIGYIEHLGEGSETIWGVFRQYDTSWNFPQASILPADFIKLREVSLTYNIPPSALEKLKIKGLAVSVFSRNIMLWTKAKVNIDPERAFVPTTEGEGRRGIQMRQGTEEFNIEPWVMPMGVKLNVTF